MLSEKVRSSIAAAVEDWKKRQSTDKSADLLSAELGGCIEFPIEAIPKVLQPLIIEGATAIQCPPDYIAIPLLTSMGAAIGRTRVLEVKPGWKESTALWTVIIGTSGTAKSPAFDLVTQPLGQIQQKWVEEYRLLLKAYKKNMRHEIDLKKSKAQQQEEPEKPVLKRILVSDTTVEALATVMRDNPRGIILLRDELAGWVNSMNQYKSGKGSDYQFYLATWGGGPFQIDRKNLEEPVILPQTYLAVSGSVQQGVLSRLLTTERQEEGFAARILISYPLEMERKWVDEGVEESLLKPVTGLFFMLSELEFAKTERGLQPEVVQFSEDGHKAFKEVVSNHYQQQRRYGLKEPLAAHWAKMEGHTARMALIIHLIRYHTGETCSKNVDQESVYMAAALADYFKAHIAKYYGKLQQIQAIALYEQIIRWAKKKNKQEITTRDIYTARITPDAEATKAVLDGMAKRGLGKWEDAESKRKFILTPTQQSATQQSPQAAVSPIGNQSKWLGKLRELRQEKRKRKRLSRIVLQVLRLKLRNRPSTDSPPPTDEGITNGDAT